MTLTALIAVATPAITAETITRPVMVSPGRRGLQNRSCIHSRQVCLWYPAETRIFVSGRIDTDPCFPILAESGNGDSVLGRSLGP